MKNIILTLAFLLIFSVLSFAQSDASEPPACGLPFDTYNQKTSWNEERTHLDNFAFYLKKESELIGYVYMFSEEKESSEKIKSRTNRIIKYLTKDIGSNFVVEKSRIVFIYKRNADRSETILQPILKGFKPPEL